jgi:periplasmic divalent cation tolerance protein
MTDKINFISIRTTTNKEDEAKMLSNNIIEKNWAACIHVIPNATSYYKWKNEICSDNEFLIEIKTINKFQKNVEQEIKKTISYDCPQIIVDKIQSMSTDYENWFKEVFYEQ